MNNRICPEAREKNATVAIFSANIELPAVRIIAVPDRSPNPTMTGILGLIDRKAEIIVYTPIDTTIAISIVDIQTSMAYFSTSPLSFAGFFRLELQIRQTNALKKLAPDIIAP